MKGEPLRNIKSSQVDKVINIENKMHELLKKVSKYNIVSEVKKCTVIE